MQMCAHVPTESFTLYSDTSVCVSYTKQKLDNIIVSPMSDICVDMIQTISVHVIRANVN